jgi:hypothetical protein
MAKNPFLMAIFFLLLKFTTWPTRTNLTLLWSRMNQRRILILENGMGRFWHFFQIPYLRKVKPMTKKTPLYVRFWILLLFTSCQLNVFFKYTLLVWNLTMIFSSTVNKNLFAIAIFFLLLMFTDKDESNLLWSRMNQGHFCIFLQVP